MKTYKFLACLDVKSGELDSALVAKLKKNYMRLWKIKAQRITTARKMALAKLERLAKRTKLPWTLIEENDGRIQKVGATGLSDDYRQVRKYLKSKRLALLIDQGRCISYAENVDKKYAHIKWFIYGCPETNEIIVKVQSNKAVFYDSVPSEVVYPPMRDRVFGIDVTDEVLASKLSDKMWKQHKAELLIKEEG
jgi:hypothetical protein